MGSPGKLGHSPLFWTPHHVPEELAGLTVHHSQALVTHGQNPGKTLLLAEVSSYIILMNPLGQAGLQVTPSETAPHDPAFPAPVHCCV